MHAEYATHSACCVIVINSESACTTGFIGDADSAHEVLRCQKLGVLRKRYVVFPLQSFFTNLIGISSFPLGHRPTCLLSMLFRICFLPFTHTLRVLTPLLSSTFFFSH